MKLLELFSGTKSVSKVFDKHGHDTYSIDFNEELNPDLCIDILDVTDVRMKPTDIWTNHPNPKFKPMCKNGDSCHVSAPRGSKTGTQGLKWARGRGVIPEQLCEHVCNICEETII